MTMHLYFSTPLRRDFLLTSIQIRGTTETRWCVADAVRIQVIALTARLTLRASYLPLPPSSSSPCSHSSSLILTLVAKHMVYRGVSTQLPLIKINWHFDFTINPFRPSFFFIASFPHIFRNSPCRKNAPLFSVSPQSRNPFLPLFPLLRFLLLFDEYANYLYRRNWNHPINPVGRILGFIEGKGR